MYDQFLYGACLIKRVKNSGMHLSKSMQIVKCLGSIKVFTPKPSDNGQVTWD